MFPELETFEPDEKFLQAIGRAGGLCDCEDDTDTPGSLGEEAAGWPIFGQFVAHDITADRSALQSHVNPADNVAAKLDTLCAVRGSTSPNGFAEDREARRSD